MDKNVFIINFANSDNVEYKIFNDKAECLRYVKKYLNLKDGVIIYKQLEVMESLKNSLTNDKFLSSYINDDTNIIGLYEVIENFELNLNMFYF